MTTEQEQRRKVIRSRLLTLAGPFIGLLFVTSLFALSSELRPVFYTGGGIVNSGPQASTLLRELVAELLERAEPAPSCGITAPTTSTAGAARVCVEAQKAA